MSGGYDTSDYPASDPTPPITAPPPRVSILTPQVIAYWKRFKNEKMRFTAEIMAFQIFTEEYRRLVDIHMFARRAYADRQEYPHLENYWRYRLEQLGNTTQYYDQFDQSIKTLYEVDKEDTALSHIRDRAERLRIEIESAHKTRHIIDENHVTGDQVTREILELRYKDRNPTSMSDLLLLWDATLKTMSRAGANMYRENGMKGMDVQSRYNKAKSETLKLGKTARIINFVKGMQEKKKSYTTKTDTMTTYAVKQLTAADASLKLDSQDIVRAKREHFLQHRNFRFDDNAQDTDSDEEDRPLQHHSNELMPGDPDETENEELDPVQPTEDDPVHGAPSHDVPMQAAPMQDVPGQDVPGQDVPGQDVPIQDVPIQDVPIQDVPIEDDSAASVAQEHQVDIESAKRDSLLEASSASEKADYGSSASTSQQGNTYQMVFTVEQIERVSFHSHKNNADIPCTDEDREQAKSVKGQVLEDFLLQIRTKCNTQNSQHKNPAAFLKLPLGLIQVNRHRVQMVLNKRYDMYEKKPFHFAKGALPYFKTYARHLLCYILSEHPIVIRKILDELGKLVHLDGGAQSTQNSSTQSNPKRQRTSAPKPVLGPNKERALLAYTKMAANILDIHPGEVTTQTRINERTYVCEMITYIEELLDKADFTINLGQPGSLKVIKKRNQQQQDLIGETQLVADSSRIVPSRKKIVTVTVPEQELLSEDEEDMKNDMEDDMENDMKDDNSHDTHNTAVGNQALKLHTPDKIENLRLLQEDLQAGRSSVVQCCRLLQGLPMEDPVQAAVQAKETQKKPSDTAKVKAPPAVPSEVIKVKIEEV